METNQNKSSQPQGRSNQSSQGNTNSTPGSNSSSQFSQSNSNDSHSNSNSSGSNQESSSSLGGMNMDNLTQQFQKYSGPIMNKVNSLSTTQKVIGGTLLAAGAGWLAMNSKNKKNSVNNINRTPRKKY